MKTLTVDIETTPNLAHVWALWNQNVGTSQLLESSDVLCAAWKWHGDKQVHFGKGVAFWNPGDDCVEDLHAALGNADAVVTWNGDRFDIPRLNTYWMEYGLGEPAPFQSIDLLKTVRKRFKFPSNKLDYVADRLLGQKKLPHIGHQMWINCMAGDEAAWNAMRKYNERDVKLTEKLYDKLLPWIPNHPSTLLFESGLDGCPTCGGTRYERRGYSYTAVSSYPRFHCLNSKCGRWFRGTVRAEGAQLR